MNRLQWAQRRSSIGVGFDIGIGIDSCDVLRVIVDHTQRVSTALFMMNDSWGGELTQHPSVRQHYLLRPFLRWKRRLLL